MNEKMDMKEYTIEYGTEEDIDELERLYDDLNDYLEASVNYPGWIKGIYPVRENAVNGVKNNNLFVLRINNKIAGSVILSHEPEKAYSQVTWEINTDYDNIFVIHTLVVHPEYLKRGVGQKLMDFAESYGKEQGMKAVRLDVSVNNTPAIALYEKSRYKYIGTVDLGLNYEHLKWFKLYELKL